MASLLLHPLRSPSMLTSPISSQARRAGGALPVLIVVAALTASAVLFFVFTRPALEQQKQQAAVRPAPVAQPAPPVKPVPPPLPAKPAPVTPPPPAPVSFGFARPLDVGKELARTLAVGDFERAGQLASASDPALAAQAKQLFERLVKGLKIKVGREDQVELLGQVENRTRVAVPLTLSGHAEPLRLQLDLERDDRMGWKIARLQLPKEAGAAMAALQGAEAPAAPTPAKPAGAAPAAARKPAAPLFVVEESVDALTFGSDFVRALLKHDFLGAQKFIDAGKVPTERLAGLCIVFEEGEYELKPAKPLIITVANPEVSWVIAQVQSQKLQQSTEFGLELQRSGLDQPWKVVGLNLSEILASFASSAAKMGVPYTPIVKNPKGGESLALYFEYDQSVLHERAQKQLEIVAGLLKSDSKRRLQIAGHTDAKGTETYNISLSQARAETVKRRLAELGVAAHQIVTTGLGKAQPLGPNQKADGSDDPEGRSKNRRAEIYLDF